MQYPPLADGTFRYGDEPRPLPSPVPGPDAEPTDSHPATAQHPGAPDHPATAPYEGTPPPPDPSEQAAEQARKRKRDSLAAAAIVGAAALVVVVILGLAFVRPDTGPGAPPGRPGPGIPDAQAPTPGALFAVEGRFTVVTSPGEPVSGDATGCDLPPSLSDIGESSAIALSRQDGTRIDVARLSYDDGDLSSCTFAFDFPEVPAGLSSYLIELDGRGRLVYSEQELRAGVDITLGR